eukprot:g35463.t1
MVRNWKVLSFVANRAQMLYKMVSEPLLGLTDVEEATLGAANAVDHIDGCAGESLSNVESLFCALNGVTREGDREAHEGEGGIRDGPADFEVGMKVVRKVDKLFKLLVETRGSADKAIDVAEEEVGSLTDNVQTPPSTDMSHPTGRTDPPEVVAQ